jgi:hypothetical protein
MSRSSVQLAVSTTLALCLTACGGGGGDDSGDGGSGSPPPPPPALVSYLGTTGVFAAWADPSSAHYEYASTNTYAGKKQSLRGTIDFMTGASLGQPAGVEIYKGSDGHIYGLDLTGISPPAPQQLSSETAATIDDTCTLSGTAVAGANYDYVGVYFTADLQNPTNSTYIYRLPGPDGTCNTSGDVFHMVKTGMSATDAPIAVSAIPVATVRTPSGGISGFVIKSGANLVLVDSNFGNSIVLGTFSAPIEVAAALPVGTTEGYPTGQLYVVDGNIVYVDYAAHTVSAPLYSIPNWLPTNTEALFAASPTTLYFSIFTAATQSTPASTNIYAMPADGSAAPTVVDAEPGRVTNLLFPIQGSTLLVGDVANGAYSILSLPVVSGGPVSTLVSSTQNSGTFIATASTVYYETWSTTTDTTNLTITRTGTQSGIVGMDGTVIQAPLAGSTFVSGGEQEPWPNNDTTTTNTPFETVFEVRGLSTVTVTNPSNQYRYTVDAVSGGTLVAIDTTSNQVVATVGTLPTSNAVSLSGTFRSTDHDGFLEATNPASTQNPETRDLYILNSRMADELTRVTGNL